MSTLDVRPRRGSTWASVKRGERQRPRALARLRWASAARPFISLTAFSMASSSGFSTRNAYYLRISRDTVLSLYIYVEQPYVDWMTDYTLQVREPASIDYISALDDIARAESSAERLLTSSEGSHGASAAVRAPVASLCSRAQPMTG